MPQQQNDKMVFYKNHKVQSFESGRTQNGTWSFDLSSSLLVITDDINKAKAMMRVGKITPKECVLEFNDPKGKLVKLHMITAPK